MDMSEVKRRFFSGDTLQQALVQAANHFQLQPEQIAYRAIEKRHGFVKMRRKVMIEVDPDSPQRAPGEALPTVADPLPVPVSAPPAPPPASPRPSPPPQRVERSESEADPRHQRREHGQGGPPHRRSGSPPPFGFRDADLDDPPPPRDQGLLKLPDRSRSVAERYPEAQGPQAEAAAKGVELLLHIAGLELTGKVCQGEERLEIDLQGPDSDWCFADDGELLMSIEHLLPRIIRSLSGEAVLCRVDCDNFHEIREERLRSLAQKVADEVRLRGKPRTMLPMNPADRRIVHVTLADNPAVETESQGQGYFKRITVRPAPVSRET
jgi:predicted RNA-binding protein Jag